MVPKFLKGIHWPIVFVMLVLAGIGIIAIYAASFRMEGDYASKQFLWMGLAILTFFLGVWVGYRPFFNMAYLLYAISIVLLVYVLIFGGARSGASRWIDLGPYALQPSELAKLATILVLADFFSSRNPTTNQLYTVFLGGLLVVVPVFLILKQPDLGSALVFFPIFFAIIFLWGIRIRYLITFFLMSAAAVPFLWHVLKSYQQKRILVFINPSIDPTGASYTAIQSKIAVGSGGFLGKGYLQGTQTQLDFVPEHHTDFILSVIGEEFGFLGIALLIFLFVQLIRYSFQIMRHTTDLKARYLALGIATMFFFQVFINMGMTIGIAPITGITLPFISYGGSSLMVCFFAVGLLVSIYRERSIF